jgi:hypothetical protein
VFERTQRDVVETFVAPLDISGREIRKYTRLVGITSEIHKAARYHEWENISWEWGIGTTIDLANSFRSAGGRLNDTSRQQLCSGVPGDWCQATGGAMRQVPGDSRQARRRPKNDIVCARQAGPS